MLQVFSSLLTHMAPEGHFFMHIPQDMHRDGSRVTLPREMGVHFAGTDGYLQVAGLRRTVRIAVFAISKNAIAPSPLRAADAGIDREDDHRHISEIAPLEHPHEGGEVRQGGSPDAGPHEMPAPITLYVMDEFSPRLLRTREIIAFRVFFGLSSIGPSGIFDIASRIKSMDVKISFTRTVHRARQSPALSTTGEKESLPYAAYPVSRRSILTPLARAVGPTAPSE